MNNKMVLFAFAATGAVLVGCTTTGTPPLIFGQAHIVGISASAGTSGQPGDFTLGYKSYDLAIVPVIAESNGQNTQIESASPNGAIDALSVLGQFAVKSGAGSTANTSLGEFFSTGSAAQVLAVGFATNLCNATNPDGSSNQQQAGGAGSATPGGAGTSQGQGGDVGAKVAGRAADCASIFGTIARAVAAEGPTGANPKAAEPKVADPKAAEPKQGTPQANSASSPPASPTSEPANTASTSKAHKQQ